MKLLCLLATFCLLISTLYGSRVSFADKVEEETGLRPILKNSSSSSTSLSSSYSSQSPSRKKKKKTEADLALADLEELGSGASSSSSPLKEKVKFEGSNSGSSSGKLADIFKPTSVSRTSSRRKAARKDEDFFLAVLKSAYTEFEHLFISNHSYYTPEELDHRRQRRGETRDYGEIAVRMSRPFGIFLIHLMMCYNFPFSGWWILMLAIDALVLAAWKRYDADWMMSEIGHWDYLAGAVLLAAAGTISVIHQVVSFITDTFFLISPVILTFLYLGLLMYGRLHRDVY